MAKSKSGGTRSYIRGRVGADVYSIGRDAKGAKQQVVRSLAETVANPQTIAQMHGRMIMSTVMQAVSGLRPIIDHSFDNVPTGQPNISEFISRNYALIKADVAANPATGNAFPLVAYQQKGIKGGAYIISAGEVIPASALVKSASGDITVTISEGETVGSLKTKLGITSDDYVTLVWLCPNVGVCYVRFRIDPSVADTTAVNNSMVNALFLKEGNTLGAAAIAESTLTLSMAPADGDSAIASGFIVSKKESSGYKHSTCTIANAASDLYNSSSADKVLPSYPIGSQMYLNGGNL